MKFLTTFFSIVILLICLNLNAQWVQMSNGISNSTSGVSLTISGLNIIVGTSGMGVYISSNNGQNWTQTNLNNKNVTCFASSGSTIYAGTNNPLSPSGVYVSNTGGSTWTQTSFNNRNVNSIAIIGNNIFAGINDYGVWLSTNNGSNWAQTTLTDKTVRSLAVSGNTIYAGIQHPQVGAKGMYKSTNNGQTWSYVGLYEYDVYSIAINGSNIFAGTSSNGVFYSNNNGQNWSQTTMNNKTVTTIITNGNNTFAGTWDQGVYLSTNNGLNWLAKNQGFSLLPTVSSLLIANNYMFLGADIKPVFRRSYTEVINVQNISTEIPLQYSLSQNYPNPFNPGTVIRFSLPRFSQVILKVYDAMGREVQNVVNESLMPGTYEASFDGSKLTSGVYFYKLITENFSDTRKMILIK